MNRRAFRKAAAAERKATLRDQVQDGLLMPDSALSRAISFSGSEPDLLSFCDSMVENAYGAMPVPLGLATGFLIDGKEVDLPLATEEPSVIAAASFMASVLAGHGGLRSWASDPVMTASVYIEQARTDADETIRAAEPGLEAILKPMLASMHNRGGGYRHIQVEWLPGHVALRVNLHIDVRDAMGANLLNSCAESLSPALEKLSGGQVLLAILSNQAASRLAGAEFTIPVNELSRGSWRGQALAQRIVNATLVADLDPTRGVTHNKGIMNGISALALASGNDTRGIEAAAHAWAARDGHYKSLSSYRIEDDTLIGRIELPLPFGTVGGATAVHPVAAFNRAIMGNPGATQLSRYAAALGLTQNFAALMALCGEGIQHGHMKLHARRLDSE